MKLNLDAMPMGTRLLDIPALVWAAYTMKQLGVFPLPGDVMLVHRKVTRPYPTPHE